MTPATVHLTLRLSPQLKAEFCRIIRSRGKNPSTVLVDHIRAVVIAEGSK